MEGAALATMAIGPNEAWTSAVARQDNVPNGTGDLFAALFTGYRLGGRSMEQALGAAVDAVEQAICASRGHDELQLVAMLHSINGHPGREPVAMPSSSKALSSLVAHHDELRIRARKIIEPHIFSAAAPIARRGSSDVGSCAIDGCDSRKVIRHSQLYRSRHLPLKGYLY